MHILHICSHKWSIPSPAIFIPTIYGALSSRSVSHCESDRTIYAAENIGLIILKRPLRREDASRRAESLPPTGSLSLDRYYGMMPQQPCLRTRDNCFDCEPAQGTSISNWKVEK